MAVTNYERVTRALEHLRAGLAGFVEQEFRSQYGEKAQTEALRFLGDDRLASRKPISEWDAAALLKVMWEGWNEVFRQTLGQAERTLVSELREWRNKWAHQEPFSSDDAYRVLDSAERLLSAVAAPQAEELARMKQELLRVRYDEQVRAERRKLGGSLVEAAAAGALRPWREVIAPHPDVASGRYQQAEFAADLWQVYLGEAASEYQNPKEFFRRTYLTENLKHLLVQAVKRLSGTGGDPVIQLQTNFGGGKTHAMIALYHLFGGYSPAELPGVDVVMAEAGVHTLPHARRVVLVGNRISPGNPMVKRDGTVVRTLWGELAWQLGFAAGGLEEARKAYEEILDRCRAFNPQANIQGVLVEKMARGGVEVILGATRDPTFGPMCMFGLGGTYVEALKDVTFRLAPMWEISAEIMIRSVRSYPVLTGIRGAPPSDIAAIQDCILRLSQMVSDHPEIAELDINPLIVYPAGQGCVVADSRMLLVAEGA